GPYRFEGTPVSCSDRAPLRVRTATFFAKSTSVRSRHFPTALSSRWPRRPCERSIARLEHQDGRRRSAVGPRGDVQAIGLRIEQGCASACTAGDAVERLVALGAVLEDVNLAGAATDVDAAPPAIEEEIVGVAAGLQVLQHP